MPADKHKQKIKNYTIAKIIGKGGMGEVYLAKHPTLKRDIILKKLSIKDKESSERFLQEAKIMLEFRHENIVQIYDHFKEGSSTYIAMEYVKGKALNEIIQENKKIPVPLALFILYQITLGIHHAHTKNVIHRDIKPHNILISVNGNVKITDFGIAKSAEDDRDEITKSGVIIGTPAYMPPEQFSNSEKITIQADIYSLGIVFYEMVTGARPYKNEFTPEVIACITKGNCTPATKYIKDLPLIARRILARTFNPKLSHRYKNLIPLIKILRRYFNRFNVFEIKDSIKRLLAKDKKILSSPFLLHYQKSQKQTFVFTIVLISLIILGGLSLSFIMTNRYYEWIVPFRYGKVIFEFNDAKMDPDHIFVGINRKYEKVNTLIRKGDRYFKEIYLPKGEHEFTVVYGSYKNSRKAIIANRITQKKSKETLNGQIINIPITNPWQQEVIVYFRFWDAISNKLLFLFNNYDSKSIRQINDEEENLKVWINSSYMTLKNYILYCNKYNIQAFTSKNVYNFMVNNYEKNGILYDLKKFKLDLSIDDRTVVTHIPLTPVPARIIIRNDTKSLPLYINDEQQGLVYNGGEYLLARYGNTNIRELQKKNYYREILIPPGKISFKLTKNGKIITKDLKSAEELIINVKKEHGKYIY